MESIQNRAQQLYPGRLNHRVGLRSFYYGTYKKWVHLRQTCLAHLIRKAKALSEAKDKLSQDFGEKY